MLRDRPVPAAPQYPVVGAATPSCRRAALRLRVRVGRRGALPTQRHRRAEVPSVPEQRLHARREWERG
jgi:hypothetical protein